MLNITGLNNFYYLRDLHDIRCKYEKVLSVIHQQCNKEPEEGNVFIVMTKNQRLFRLFNFEHNTFSKLQLKLAIKEKNRDKIEVINRIIKLLSKHLQNGKS